MPNENNTTNENKATNVFSNYIDCDFCGRNLPNGDFRANRHTRYEHVNFHNICSNCHENEFRYSERAEGYVANEDWDASEHEWSEEEENNYEEDENYDEDEQRDEHVSYYTRRVNSKIFRMPYEKKHSNELTLGIEIEVQIRESSNLSRNDIAYNLQHEVFDNFVLCKEDASIGYGFEIVSSPATFDYHKYIWSNFFNYEEINCLKSFKDDSTGLHIHIGRNFLSQLAVGKILYFINSKQNEKFVDMVAGRKATQDFVKDSKLKINNVMGYRDRGAFNIYVHHSPTHEFRLFNGNIKKESFYRCLEFVVSLCNFAKNECSLINPNYLDFISYVRANHFEYPYLVNWLLNKKFIKDIKPKTMFYDKKKARI